MASEAGEAQLQVRFITKQEQYVDVFSKLLLPVAW